MNLDDFIITCFCTIDEIVPSVTQGKRLRKRGPLPKLADSEVITMELVGTYLGLSQDQEVFDSFRRHYAHFFPEMARVARTTFVRQAANLWAVKERLWCLIRDTLLLYDPAVAIVDSMPIPVCQFARAYRCHRFDDTASTGCDHTCRQTFYGFRLHLRLCWPGVITQMYLAPANVHEGEIVWDLTAGCCWATATIGFPACKQPCARSAWCCWLRFAKPVRSLLTVGVPCWAGSAIASIRSLDN